MSPRFAWDCPGFNTERPHPRSPPHSAWATLGLSVTLPVSLCHSLPPWPAPAHRPLSSPWTWALRLPTCRPHRLVFSRGCLSDHDPHPAPGIRDLALTALSSSLFPHGPHFGVVFYLSNHLFKEARPHSKFSSSKVKDTSLRTAVVSWLNARQVLSIYKYIFTKCTFCVFSFPLH